MARSSRISKARHQRLAALVLFVLAALAGAATAADDWTRRNVVLANDRLQLRLTRLTQGSKARVELTSISTVDGSLSIDLSASPLFRATLFDLETPEKALVTAGVAQDAPPDSFEMPARDLTIKQHSNKRAEIRYRNIPLGTRQRLAVTLHIDLDHEDGAIRWTADARLGGSGDLAIYEMHYPVLRTRPIGDRDDDHVLLPLTGGLELRDPISLEFMPRLRSKPLGKASNFHYPGYIDSQFLAYYDGSAGADKKTGGLYMAAEDPGGYTKAVYFRPDKAGETLELLIGHYNFAPDPFENRRKKVADGFATISIGDKLPYAVVTDLFHGDWMDAADLYRGWLDRARPPFLAKGPIHQRTDIPAEVRSTCFGFGFTIHSGKRNLGDKDPARNPDLNALKTAKLYFSDSAGKPLPSSMTLLGDLSGTGLTGNANDNNVRALRPGLVDFLANVRSSEWGKSIITLNTNRDIGNWSNSRDRKPEEVERTRRFGLVLAPTGKAARRGGEAKGPGLHGITASGSQFVHEFRMDQFRRSFARTDHQGGNWIDGVVLSGRGSQAHLCYAPMHMGKNIELHHHTVGGGNYFMEGYRRLISELRRVHGDRVRYILPGGERSHEQLIDTSLLSGRLRLRPWDGVFHGRSTWVPGAQPVPLMSWLYHDQTLIGARLNRRSDFILSYAASLEPKKPEAAVPELLNDATFLALERQRFAAAALEGRRVGVYVEGPPTIGDDAPSTWFDGPPGSVLPALERNFEFLREMFRLRGRARPWLVEGRMLRPPALHTEDPPQRLTVVEYDSRKTYEVPSILSSAWRAPNGDIAVILVNYGAAASSVTLALDPAAWGIETTSAAADSASSQETSRTLQDLAGNSIRLRRDADGRLVTETPVRVDPGKPSRVLVLR